MVVAPPLGAYTARVSGMKGATGVCLIEICEIRP